MNLKEAIEAIKELRVSSYDVAVPYESVLDLLSEVTVEDVRCDKCRNLLVSKLGIRCCSDETIREQWELSQIELMWAVQILGCRHFK